LFPNGAAEFSDALKLRREVAMGESNEVAGDLKCPECRAVLKRRRSRKVDACEMVCGGCGRIFDVCDAEARGELKDAAR
jgi:ribosomal protein L37AE/L43A